MKKLKKILKEIPEILVKGSREVEITGICADSRLVAPGNLFIAKKGLTIDGSRFIHQAVQAGAVAILTDLYDPFLPGNIVQLIHPQVRVLEAKIAAAYYEDPSKKLFLVGVTGTNGKTTTTYLIRHLLQDCGLIGTIEWSIGKRVLAAQYTTPEIITNQRLLREMVTEGCTSVAMEVSSHALEQGRVEGLDFDVAVFTNLTQDHLDYHETMEAYASAKAKLFTALGAVKASTKPWGKRAIIHADSPWAERMIEHVRGEVFRYGIQSDSQIDLCAKELELHSTGTIFTMEYRGKTLPVKTALIGRFNVDNCLAAAAVALARGISLEEIALRLQTFCGVPGRLERVENDRDLPIFIDYAHTEDALQNVLQTLREVTKGKIITVFGCGGERDRGKRPKMGKVATSFSDMVMITSDNPRGEDPHVIISEIVAGCSDPTRYVVEVDRRSAIRKAIEIATSADVILIAGKGHERYQMVGSSRLEFDDHEVAASLL